MKFNAYNAFNFLEQTADRPVPDFMSLVQSIHESNNNVNTIVEQSKIFMNKWYVSIGSPWYGLNGLKKINLVNYNESKSSGLETVLKIFSKDAVNVNIRSNWQAPSQIIYIHSEYRSQPIEKSEFPVVIIDGKPIDYTSNQTADKIGLASFAISGVPGISLPVREIVVRVKWNVGP
jgi:hypothetical protein